jgi:hypothetical protein
MSHIYLRCSFSILSSGATRLSRSQLRNILFRKIFHVVGYLTYSHSKYREVSLPETGSRKET